MYKTRERVLMPNLKLTAMEIINSEKRVLSLGSQRKVHAGIIEHGEEKWRGRGSSQLEGTT